MTRLPACRGLRMGAWPCAGESSHQHCQPAAASTQGTTPVSENRRASNVCHSQAAAEERVDAALECPPHVAPSTLSLPKPQPGIPTAMSKALWYPRLCSAGSRILSNTTSGRYCLVRWHDVTPRRPSRVGRPRQREHHRSLAALAASISSVVFA